MSDETASLFPNPAGFSVQRALRGYDVDADTLRRLYQILSRALSEMGDSIVKGLSKPDETALEEWEQWKKSFRSQAFRVTVTITAADGTHYYGDNVSIFEDQNLPRAISTVFFTNNTAYKSFTRSDIRDRFDLFLDFTKPPLMDWSNLLSAPTPNGSNVSVESSKSMFKNTIIAEVIETLRSRRKLSSAFHRAFIYDAFLYLIAVPYGFYITSKLSNNTFVQSQPMEWRVPFYVYTFLLIAFAYRFLFSYFKWAFPINTFKTNDDPSSKHRAFFSLMVLALLGSAFYDAIKWLFLS
ncbi:hypothetical protein [Microvirga sp. VF16]|uniref:hypothetical protein n=1 Tax=Microvirga sp. VF16 TaxID=2807101 RepID=UPI00193CA31E|nr:hypothetical protein [Microvirga sp. VF16]QRM30416.1 hypothetical protein JO965_05245 [Microvirga sp. VF16]